MTEKPPKELNKLSMILHATVEKAMNNGFSFKGRESLTAGSRGETTGEFIEHNGHYQFIFDHRFAQALWPDFLVFDNSTKINVDELSQDQYIEYSGKPPRRIIGWQHHLQQMVLADDPIVYLGENT